MFFVEDLKNIIEQINTCFVLYDMISEAVALHCKEA